MENLSRHAPKALAVLRILTALLFIQHGTAKLFGFPAMQGMEGSLPPMMLIAGILELVGGLAILVGFLTRPVAFVLSGMMAVAYFMAHAPMDFFPANNFGEPAIFYCFVFLYMVFAGPGAWSVDEARRKA